MTFTLEDISQHIGAEIKSSSDIPENLTITGIGTLVDATDTEISFLANDAYRKQIHQSAAAAIIMTEKDSAEFKGVALVIDNPYLAYAKISRLFDRTPVMDQGRVHASAIVAATARIADTASIGPNAVIGDGVVIGEFCQIAANCVIGERSQLASYVRLNPNVTLYHDVTVGEATVIHSGAVIGSDGFGFAPTNGQWEKIAQLGGVRIGHHCDIGANTCIDRGALTDTILGNHIILDNMVHIAHNVVVGDGTAMAGGAAIAGSSSIGKNCTIGGRAGIAGHLTICDNTFVAAMSLISKSINEPGGYASGTAQMPIRDWRKSATRFRQLDLLVKRVQQLENSKKESVDENE